MGQERSIRVQLWGARGLQTEFFPSKYEWGFSSPDESRTLTLWFDDGTRMVIRIGFHTIIVEEKGISGP